MAVQNIVLEGFGSLGSASLIVTRGYAAGTPPPPVVGTRVDGGRLRRRPEEIAREQRMVQEYLDSLQRVAIKVEQHAPARQIKAAIKAVPVLTDAVIRAANEQQIREILESAAAERDIQIARAEKKRRYVAAFTALMLSD